MKLLKKVLCGFLILSLMTLYFPKIAFAANKNLIAKSDIKKHVPEVKSSPEELISKEPPKGTWQWMKKHPYWTLLGVLAVAGGIGAAAGGGGTTSSSGDSGAGSSDSGSGGHGGDITIIW